MTQATAGLQDRSAPGVSARQVAAVAAGNALEFYDFLTYSFFALQIGRSFFPSHDAGTSLLASLATFGVGFLTRPVGALVIGRLADRRGRRPAMLLTFLLMGVAMVGLALTPPYRSLGVAAPVLAILFRLVQGFALGGEVGPSTAFLIEAAPPHRRGLFVSLQFMGQRGAVLCAGLIGVGLSSRLSEAALDAYGWRIALLAGAVIIPFGLSLRRGLAETLHLEAPSPPPSAGADGPGRVVLLGLALLAGTTIVNYGLDYMTTYARATLHMPSPVAFGATVVVGSVGMLANLLGGWLSDRLGRRPVVIASLAVLLVLTFPCYALVSHVRTGAALFVAAGALSAAYATGAAAVLVAVTEALPQRTRAASLALIYAAAIATFGGSAQLVVAWLTRATGSPLAPAGYMAAAAAVALLAMLAMRETAPARAPLAARA